MVQPGVKRDSVRHHPAVNGPSGASDELPLWVRRQDLTEADLPYIHTLLADSFEEWLEQADGFPWLPACRIVLLHPDCTRVAVSPGDADAPAPAEWSRDILGDTAASLAIDSCRPAHLRADEHSSASLRAFDSLAVPVFSRTSGFVFAALACLLPAGSAQGSELKLLQAAALHFRSCLYRRFELLFVRDLLQSNQLTSREERRRNMLFDVMRRLHDHIDVENVLSEVFNSLEQLYPLCRSDLFLSQDYSSTNEKVKPLSFHLQDMDLCWRAFMDGERREETDAGRRRIAFPLAGKQGVYGVLRLDVAEDAFDEVDVRFVAMLTGGAGTAFEKARLHEQANVLIGELRLINELTQRLNSSLRLSDTMQFATAELLHLFKADHCFILQLDPMKGHFTVMSSNVAELHQEVFATDYGFCGVMLSTKEPIILSDYRSATPVSSHLMEVTRSRSLLASPLLLNGEVIGAVMVAHEQANHFSYDNYKLLQVLSAHLGLAVSNASLHAEVRRMVITDNLTGLFARHYLNERIQRKQEKDVSGSLIVVDIDHFKKINDTYGHQVGDAILMQVSTIIRAAIRESDIAARWGGEELAIYLPQLSLDQTLRVAERIRKRVEAETAPKVTVSCGVSEWTSGDDRVSVESLFYRADMALYEAKHRGRNCVAIG
ncbi:GGDEF domain-containing protein [Cohnella nanjingensis]|uniref:Diguanylate cyclase n=1 Tax=Cohnella nanjingensis TaxID=1387779 RepID=A0A7X0RRE5_9BACL|nr:diguanylate cyclase [Cohnella nanjingensis]MBB6671131.1 diguanylate cyclase [Cohnella nanjingensis]